VSTARHAEAGYADDPAAEGSAVRVNDQAVSLDGIPANWTLADLIRYRTTLRGTHLACEHGVCGVCTVLLDGEPVRSCLVLSHAVGDRQVTTVEGLDLIDADLAGRLRAAFLSRNAFQCGFCTPGMLALVFAAARQASAAAASAGSGNGALPAAGSGPDARQVIDANICRCTGYSAIAAAAGDVLQQAREPGPDARADG
jgi:aerobic carbon-monoxide dehydrogenase small subunit